MLANVPNKYLSLKLILSSFKSLDRAQVLTVTIMAIAAKSSKQAKIKINIRSKIPIIDPTSNTLLCSAFGKRSWKILFMNTEEGIVNVKNAKISLVSDKYSEKVEL